jgi:fibronectin type 3 domain-containing protein
VFRGTQALGSVLSASTLSFTDTTSGTSYSVVATDSRGIAFTSNSVTPSAPNISFCSGNDLQVAEAAYCAVTGPAVHLAWTAGASPDGYFISDASGTLVAFVDSSKSSFDITGLTGGRNYRYSVNNTDANNGQFVTTPSCSGPPGNTTLSATTSCASNSVSVQLSWTAASSVTQYRVYRDGVVVNATTSRTFTDTNVVSGHAYSYTVSALNGSGSTESNTLSVTGATCTSPPGAFAATATAFCTTGASPAPAVHIRWTASSNAASYVVNRNGVADTSSWSSATLALDDLNVIIGQTYNYTVTATNSGGSTTSSGQSVTIAGSICPVTPPTAPALTETTTCNGTSPANHLSWSASANATGYVVYRNGTALSAALSAATLTYDDESVAPGQSYAYVVRASNGGGTADSNTINISLPTTICQPPPLPFTLRATAVCDLSSTPAPIVRLTWSASVNATGYLLFRNELQIGDIVATLFADTNVALGSKYTYLVRAYGAGGTTDSNAFEVQLTQSVCTAPCGFACAATVATTASEQSPVRFALQQQTSCDGVSATWSFGDGTGSDALTPTHNYPAGTYRWSVVVFSNGTTATCQNGGTIAIAASPAPSKRHAVRH